MMLIRGFSRPGLFCGGFGYMYPWGWLAIAAVVIVGVTLAIILSVRRKRQSQRDDALETLKLRYVKGELSEEDYLKMKEVVGK